MQLLKGPGQANQRHNSVWNPESKSLPKVHTFQRLESTRLHKHLPGGRCHQNANTRMQTRVCQVDTECTDCSSSPQATKWIKTISKLLTGKETRLHEADITVRHKTGPGSTPRYARLRTISVVGVARKGTLIHCAGVPGHPYTC